MKNYDVFEDFWQDICAAYCINNFSKMARNTMKQIAQEAWNARESSTICAIGNVLRGGKANNGPVA